MKQIKKYVLESYKQMNTYFRDSRNDIVKSNLSLLQSLSLFGFGIVGLLLIITPYIIPEWVISIGHYLFIPYFLVYLGVSHYLKSQNVRNYALIHSLVLSFIGIFVVLIIYINTVPFPNSSASLLTATMIVLPVLFIVPFHEMVLTLLITFLLFLIMNNQFIVPEMRGNNVFNAITGLLFGLMVAWVVTNLRAADDKSKQEVVRKSNHDRLTGILNKSAVEQECFTYLETEKDEKCVMIVIDVDNFKHVNDSQGHFVGDQVLNLFGETLQHVFRGSDICGRIGGDEFVVLMKKVADKKLVEMKMNAFSALFSQGVFEKLNVPISCSYGAIVKDDSYISYVPLFNMADKILYRSKNAGKNRGNVLSIEEYDEMMSKKEIMLIVDDAEVNLGLLRNIFEDEFDIILAVNGREAIDQIEKHHNIISIMLLDIIMPEVDGFQVLDWMKEQKEIHKFPVIAISSDIGAELPTLEMGVSDMITKPFHPEVLRKRVHNAMKKTGR